MIRNMHPALGVLVLLLCALQAPAQQGRPADEEIITNYWVHLSRLLAAEQAAPVPEPPDQNQRYPPPKQYAFDTIQHLSATELRRAAMEGIKEAERIYIGQAQSIIDEHVGANILIALQYYPLVATRIEDFRELLFMLEDGNKHPVLRRILLTRLVPGLAPPSLIGDYLQNNFSRESDRINKLVGAIAFSTIEDADIQTLAMEVLYQLRFQEYSALLNSDSNVRAQAEDRGAPLRPIGMKQPDAPVLTKAIELRFDAMTGNFEAMAKRFLEHFDPLRNRPDAVKAKAKELVQRILDTVPLENPDAISQLLEAA